MNPYRAAATLVTLALAGLGFLFARQAHASGADCQVLLEVDSTRMGGEVVVKVQLSLPVPPTVAWDVMTDYDNAARFIKNLRQSHAIAQGPDKFLVQQVGWVGWKGFGTQIRTHYEVQLKPALHRVTGQLVSGDIKAMQMNAYLEAPALTTTQRTVLHYSVSTDPGTWIPSILAEGVLRQHARSSFEDLVQEMQRRSPSCGAPPSANGSTP